MVWFVISECHSDVQAAAELAPLPASMLTYLIQDTSANMTGVPTCRKGHYTTQPAVLHH